MTITVGHYVTLPFTLNKARESTLIHGETAIVFLCKLQNKSCPNTRLWIKSDFCTNRTGTVQYIIIKNIEGMYVQHAVVFLDYIHADYNSCFDVWYFSYSVK